MSMEHNYLCCPNLSSLQVVHVSLEEKKLIVISSHTKQAF
jgi:hypothetical protein